MSAELIRACIEAKQGNKEFALFFFPEYEANERTKERVPDTFTAQIGNPNAYVRLGEVDGEFSAEGATAEEAVANLLAMVLRDP